jgi:hypothetical protein
MGNTGTLNRQVYIQMTQEMASQQVRVSLSVPGDSLNDDGRVY